MPLIQSKSEIIAGKIISSIVNIQSHFAVAINELNRINKTILDLNNDELAHFGNFLGVSDMQSLSELHIQQGSTVNSLIESLGSVLSSVGPSRNFGLADIRSLGEKLADQNRKIVITDGVFSVEDIPVPEPEVILEDTLASEMILEEPLAPEVIEIDEVITPE